MRKAIYILALAVMVANVVSARDKKSTPQDTIPVFSEKEAELFTYYFYEAQRCFELKEYDQSLMLAEYCLTLNPQDAECHELLGMIYGAMTADDIAAEHLYKAVESAPKVWRYRRTYTSILYHAGKIDEAIEILKQGTEIDPDNAEIWSSLSAMYQNKNDYTNSIKALNQAERIEGPDRNYVYQKYQMYIALGEKKKAHKEIDKYIKAFPQDYEFQCLQGNMYLSDGKTEEALNIFNRILKEHPENPYIYSSLVNYYIETGDEERAVQWTVDALKSTHLDATSRLSVLNDNIDLLEKQHTDIGHLLLDLIEQDPLNEALHNYYSRYLEQQGDTTELIKELLTITDINPTRAATWTKLIDIAITMNDDTLFSDVTNRAIEAQPLDPQWYLFKSILLVREKKFERAKDCSQTGISLADKDLNTKLALYRQLGDIYSLLEQYDSTYAAYDLALELNPDDYYVLNNYAYTLATHGGDLKKAEHMSSKTIKKEPTNATYLDTYAWILYLQGDKTLSKFFIEKAREYAKPEEATDEIEEHYKIIHNQ